MKTVAQFISIWLIIAVGLTSCVSSKKYKDSVSRCSKSFDSLQAQYDIVNSDKAKLESMSQSNTKELGEREKKIAEEEKHLKELQSVMDAQRDAITNLKKEVCSALKCFTPDELTVEVREGKLYVSMSDKLLFPSGSDEVNKRGKDAITMLADVLKNSDLEIMVEGHTDNVPISTERNKDNWDLSAHRATSVTRLFIERGIAPERIIASGRAEFHPLKPNDSADGRAGNRRTEVVLSPKLDKLWKLTNTGNLEGVSQSE